MMQHRPTPDQTRDEGSPAGTATSRALPTPVAAPHPQVDIDLTDPNKQRVVAADLHRLLDNRQCDSGTYVQYFDALHRYELSELERKNILFTPELQVQVVQALSTNGFASGYAETILTKIAKMEGSIHEDALVALVKLAHAEKKSARSCAIKLAKLESPPPGLFVGDLGSTFGAMVAERPGLWKHPTPKDLIAPCADFMSDRLRFVMNGASSIPLGLRARAFTETLLFFAEDIANSKKWRLAAAERVLRKHELLETVDEVVKGCATSLWGAIRTWLLRKEPDRCMRVKKLFPIVDKEALAHGFREAFMKRFASRPE
jgi:hypothetical protein